MVFLESCIGVWDPQGRQLNEKDHRIFKNVIWSFDEKKRCVTGIQCI